MIHWHFSDKRHLKDVTNSQINVESSQTTQKEEKCCAMYTIYHNRRISGCAKVSMLIVELYFGTNCCGWAVRRLKPIEWKQLFSYCSFFCLIFEDISKEELPTAKSMVPSMNLTKRSVGNTRSCQRQNKPDQRIWKRRSSFTEHKIIKIPKVPF